MAEKNNVFTPLFTKNQRAPFIISGPCGAETEEQLFNTATLLKQEQKTHAFRAGIWKPRTRPGSFEGMGLEGLVWLQRVQQELKMAVGTEVANAEHVEQSLKHGLDFVWIGARTTVSPFAVQEIAEALCGVEIPVFVKNPINPDLSLWIGALERFSKANIRQIAAIHRGFSWFEKSTYRYTPKWEIPIELKTNFPNLPILCDPSHIAGNRALLKKVAQKALDLEMDGLMIETHIDPDKAWSDAQQQITPQNLSILLDALIYRTSSTSNEYKHPELEKLRLIIDELDEFMVHKLSERMNIVERIGEYKKEHDLNLLQIERWREILETRTEWAKNLALHSDFIKAFLQVLHQESLRLQTEVFQKEPDFPQTKL